MSQLGQTFNANEMPEDTGYEAIPAGWYTAQITDAELKDTRAGDGQYIAVRYDITGPNHEGRVIFGNINIVNPNPKAEAIGQQQLGSLMRAIGLGSVSDTDQLIGGNLKLKIKVKRDEEYGDANGNKNEVAGFQAIEGSAPPKPAAKPQQASAGGEQKPSGKTPPWLNK